MNSKQDDDCSDLLMLLDEFFESLQVDTVIDIGVPVEGRSVEDSVSASGAHQKLLILHIVVRESWELSTLPTEVALIPTHVEGAEEE